MTIIYEGIHHLKHKGFAVKMASMFDKWIVVEGHSLPHGSTKWCKKIEVPPTSQDGTIEFMREFCTTYKNVFFYTKGDYYQSKDTQVNAAIEILKKLGVKTCMLWQVDADEHWTLADIEQAETEARSLPSKGFKFRFNHFVGEGIIATGTWGSGYLNRLFKWSGEYFASHEPSLLRGMRGCAMIDSVKFDHYSYYFEKDVAFKSRYYTGHENVLINHRNIQKPNIYPMPISRLFGENTPIGKSNSQIIQI